MDEWSLQGLQFVLSRLHIPLQAPPAVGHKVDIPSALIAFLHNTDILVKDQEGGTECCVTQVLILVLMTTLVWHNADHQHGYPISTVSMDTLCNHLEVLG